MNKPFEIRAVEPDDIDAIGNLCCQLGYEVDQDGLQQRFDLIVFGPNQILRVAKNTDGVVVGWVHALPVCYLEADIFIEIGGLVVDSSCRRMGIGQALMTEVEDWARKHSFTMIRLRSNSKRAIAHEFYRSIGYELVKQQYTFVKQI
jgi:ribosomal protein S18 acetylase RimI-like enzyme